MLTPQLLHILPRQRPHMAGDGGEGHGNARVEHVDQLVEDDALLVTFQVQQRRGLAVLQRCQRLSDRLVDRFHVRLLLPQRGEQQRLGAELGMSRHKSADGLNYAQKVDDRGER